MIYTLILGGPGTGKTHTLLECVRREYEQNNIQPERMAYVSFTRRGTYQGVDLVKDTFDFTDEQCKYFKTLHSLCFHALDLKGSNLMTAREMNAIREHFNYSIKQFNDLMGQDAIARNALQVDEEGKVDLTALRKAKFNATQAQSDLAVFKEVRAQTSKVDFTDILGMVVDRQIELDIDVAFIDEAQDLTFLQWQVVETLFRKAKHIYFAGDVNQSLFKWAGADYDRFTKFPGAEVIFLDESHRCSRSVWQYAKFVHSNIDERIKMPEKCKEEPGFALSAPKDCPIDWLPKLARKGTVYLLGYTNLGLEYYEEYCRLNGIPYTYRGNKEDKRQGERRLVTEFLRFYATVMFDKALYDRYINWTAIGLTVPKAEKRTVRYKRDTLRKMLNNKIPPFQTLDKEAMYAYAKDRLCKGKNPMSEEYVRKYIDNEYYMLNEITISPVHRVKGGEADFVYMRDSIPHRQRRKVETDAKTKDELARVLYVAITRAKQGIILWRTQSSKNVGHTENYPSLGNINNYLKESDDDKNNQM